MDINSSIEILQALANGVDPTTGEVISPDSPYNHPDVIRALFVCVQHLKYPAKPIKKSADERQADNLQRGLPRNAGMPWTDESKCELADQFRAGLSPADLARKFERTKGSILSELTKQGLITDDESGPAANGRKGLNPQRPDPV
jgi:hypothetical protein